jgi:hypothetical protein
LEEDQSEIYESIRQHVIGIANEEISQVDNQAEHFEEPVEAQHDPREIWPLPLDDLEIFDELGNNNLEEAPYRDSNNNDLVDVVPIAHIVDAELTLHKHDSSSRQKNDDGTFTSPLTWWKFNERKYFPQIILLGFCAFQQHLPLQNIG